MQIQKNISLRPFNTFGIDVTAEWFANAGNETEVLNAIQFSKEKNLPLIIIGGGSNLLLTKPPVGLVLKMDIRGIRETVLDNESVEVEAGAGEIWHELVLYAIQRNLGGIENLSLIPGCVGAAPIQNIGAYGAEVKDVITGVKVMRRDTGEVAWMPNADCKFGYRDSIFKHELAGKAIVLAVKLRLKRNPLPDISYAALANELKKSGRESHSIREVSDAVIRVRKSKLPDPAEIGNAGSFFKNPEIPLQQFEALQLSFPALPSFDSKPGFKKVPAAWLIEQAGWKGKNFGTYGVHKDQPLVLVNFGGATGKEILELSEKIQQSVFEKFRIRLEREVNVL